MGQALELALQLAACDLKVFPCLGDKRPARPKVAGGSGFKDASNDRDHIAWLWRAWPGPLVGIATGSASGVSVLDVDAKHPEAMAWEQQHAAQLNPSWPVDTRSGGRHHYYAHRPGIRNSAGRPIPGLDVRGEGGYVIWWGGDEVPSRWNFEFAFPGWLEQLIWPPQPADQPAPHYVGQGDALVPLLRAVEQASEGTRNNILYWAARRAAEHAERGEVSPLEARRWLEASARYAGLLPSEILATLTSAGL